MPREKNPAPPDCIDCKKPFRHRLESIEEKPGTVVHSSKGRCRSCGSLYRKKFIADDERRAQDPGPRVDASAAAAGLASYMARRRKRLGA